MAEYKDTLNLPETAFPMKANLSQREPQRISDWQEQALYQQIRDANKGKKRFVLHDGPPYANGHLHCGHALNKILKDIVVKSKTLSGYDAPYLPGWDCHGLPIELNVEKKVGKAGHKISAREFRQKCREYADSQIDIQREEFIRLGVFGDWFNPYATADFTYEANILRAIAKIIENGHLQQGFKPVHWCVECGSALAEAEVEYEDKTSDSVDVAFKAVHPETLLKVFAANLPNKAVIVPIWTTTPWSFPGNEAVCLHPEVMYHLIDSGESYYIVAEELVDTVMARYAIKHYKTVAQLPGKKLVMQSLHHPIEPREVPIIFGEHVTTDSGTGAVHTAPAHGPDDYAVAASFNLPLQNPVLTNGCYADDVPFVAGMPVLKANNAILDRLKEAGNLLHHEKLTHSYPHCWRHKTPMIFLATPQWFISMEKNGLRKAILAEIDKVSWIPDWGKSRIRSMIETRPDWCISRQRAWGTPLPLFIHKETRQLHPNTAQLIEEVACCVEKEGIDTWFERDAASWIGEDAKTYEKINDTLDVWFDSGVSHFAVLAQNESLSLPADMYLEGSDQHRGWFNSSITTAVAMYGHAPYKAVLTHGYTVDAEGKKLSKSKGNYVALDKLINQNGAEILRLWVASTDYRNEVSISEEIIKRTSDAYRRIRNTARFLLANLFDFDPKNHLLPAEKLVELDSWVIKRAQQLQKEIIEAYENYNFHVVYQKIHHFCAIDLGSFYLDVIKDRQYTTPENSLARRSCQTAMYHIVHALTRWMAPLLSFTAEEIWQYIPGEENASVFLQQWYTAWPEITAVDITKWQAIQTLRDEVNKALEVKRQQGDIGSGLAAGVRIYAKGSLLNDLQAMGDELRFILITSDAQVQPLTAKPAELPENEELHIAVEVIASEQEKCARCWHRRDTVGLNSDFIDLCDRCVDNLQGRDEVRRFA